MNVVMFEGANDVIGRPKDTTPDQCDAAIIHRGLDAELKTWPVVTTCWQASEEEMEEFIRTGKVYLRLFTPVIPMMSVTVSNPVKKGWVKDDKPIQPDHPLLKTN